MRLAVPLQEGERVMVQITTNYMSCGLLLVKTISNKSNGFRTEKHREIVLFNTALYIICLHMNKLLF